MTTQRHKWADVIIAYAEGKQIQFKGKEFGWTDCSSLSCLDARFLEWRIKPTKKTYWFSIYKKQNGSKYLGGVYSSKSEALEAAGDVSSYLGTFSIEIEE